MFRSLLLIIIGLSGFCFSPKAQSICNSSGNLVIYSNYNGGILTINIDQNIPGLIVGICTYEPVQVIFTGPFVSNVTQVFYAGFNSSQNNDNCNLGNFATSVSGVAPGIVSIFTSPPVGYTPSHGNGSGPFGATMMGASGQCDTTINAGGVNTPDEIVYYFENTTGGSLFSHFTQYGCWLGDTISISEGGNCCIIPPSSSGCNLVANVSVIPNSICEPCSYNGPPILINELMISPNTGDGSISGNTTTSQGRGEWIELYNPDLCDSVDISCYYLGNSTPEGKGGFRLPLGTIVPPNGFALIRGENADSVPSNLLVANGGNVVEVIVPYDITGTGLCCTGTRVWFPNAGGWFAFYDANGNAIDAVSWGPGNIASQAQNPCISSLSACNITNTLPSYETIPDSLKFYASSQNGSSHFGLSIRRMPDGGSWAGVGNPTYAICNDSANCLTGTNIGFCNGQATVNITSGTPPFTYQWNDALNQTTQTATNLCEGAYQVIVTDAANCQDTIIIHVITNPFNLTTNTQQPACEDSNGFISIDPFDSTYTYTWLPNVSSTNSAINLSQGLYNIVITKGFCVLDTTINLQNPIPFETGINVIETSCGKENGFVTITNTPSGNYFYNWIPEVSSTNSASGLASGIYQISVTDSVCFFDTTITIQGSIGLNSTVQVINSTCEENNGSIFIAVTPPDNYSFSWNPNVSSVDSAVNLPAGIYVISFSNALCSNDTMIAVETTHLPKSIQSVHTNPSCGLSNGNLLINGITGGTPPYSYFFNGDTIQVNDSVSNIGAGTFQITVIDGNGCILTQPESFIMTNGNPTVFIPNVLTANNDQVNDLWSLDLSCIEKMNCQIFNRWGNLIYEFNESNVGWDGKTSDGKEVSDGVYFYKIIIDNFGDSGQEEFNGHITLIH